MSAPGAVLEVTRFWQGEVVDVRRTVTWKPISGADVGAADEFRDARLDCPTRLGDVASADFGAVSIEVRCIDGRACPRTWSPDRAAWLSGALSIVGHVCLLVFLVLSWEDPAEESRIRISVIQEYLGAASAREAPDVTPVDTPLPGTADSSPGRPGRTGTPPPRDSRRENGLAQKLVTVQRNIPDRSETSLRREVASFGLIGLLQGSLGGTGSPLSATILPASDNTFAAVIATANNARWDATPGDSWGDGDLVLSSVGAGGGGSGGGLGVGAIATLGHGHGRGADGDDGDAHGNCGGCGGFDTWGRSGWTKGHTAGAPGLRGHAGRNPTIRCYDYAAANPESGCSLVVQGRLPPEAIQRVVRASFGRLRACYESGLRTDPSLEGRLVVRFLIGRDGAVIAAVDADSDVPSEAVVACGVRVFSTLAFPAPEGGVVTVVYPLVLSSME